MASPNALKDIIVRMIRENGPMDVGTYMNLCLGHPRHGYYMTRDPFGAAGDFVTAPEISPMFGEMVGAWLADLWLRMGSPARVTLAEAGPGRGTLMADILRATRAVSGFHAALDIRLIETSPVLRAKQEKTLARTGMRAAWHTGLDGLDDGDGPVLCVANELLDALPIRQFQRSADGWRECLIDADAYGLLRFGLGPSVELDGQTGEDGQVIELSPAREGWTVSLAQILRRRGGAALLIDYGRDSATGDTLQAVRKHAYTPVLDDPGHADITAHVDFAALRRVAAASGCKVEGPVPQGEFLLKLGIAVRAARLGGRHDELDRLTNADQMGTLFKVMAIAAPDTPKPEGFS